MKPSHGGDIASHRADGQVLVTTRTGFLDYPANEHAANAPIPRCLSNDDRLDFPAGASVKQAGETDDAPVGLGHPRSQPSRLSEVGIESRSGIVSTDRRVSVDASVVQS
jgi:hypothetical protein